MKDFNIAKYLKENYQGPFSMFQPYTDLNPLKEEIKGKFADGGGIKKSPTEATIKMHINTYSVSDDPYEIAKELGEKYGWSEKEIEKAESIIRKKYIKEDGEEMAGGRMMEDGGKVTDKELSSEKDVTMRFDLSDPESSEDAYEWILDNISDNEDFVISKNEDYEFRQAPIEDIVDIINDRLKNATIDIVNNTITDELTQEYQEWVKQNNLPEMSADELLYDDSIEKTPEQEKYLKDFLDRWDSTDDYITLAITNTPQIKEAFSAEQEKFDRMMGLIDRTLETQLHKIKNAVDKARKMMISDKSIFNMLSTSSLTKQSVKDLVGAGFDPMDIVDFFATDFSIAEDRDNVTAADNAAYGADQEIGEPVEEEVTVSSSGVEMEGLDEEIDIWQIAGDHLEAFRYQLASAHAVASQSGQKEWVSAINKIALRLDALEGAMAEASAKLGVLPTK